MIKKPISCGPRNFTMLSMNIIRNLVIILFFLQSSCSTYQPHNHDNICDIFFGETDWYEAARDAQRQWGTPIFVMMAIMHQESRFIDDAQPARDWFLGIVPLPRDSSAYGYAQAQDPVGKNILNKAETRVPIVIISKTRLILLGGTPMGVRKGSRCPSGMPMDNILPIMKVVAGMREKPMKQNPG